MNGVDTEIDKFERQIHDCCYDYWSISFAILIMKKAARTVQRKITGNFRKWMRRTPRSMLFQSTKQRRAHGGTSPDTDPLLRLLLVSVRVYVYIHIFC
ncbi:hypothetical protein Nepgr_007382 [Nepenthes gracilis]|uniref:Uncharacterized protein n=1 Tax=Nepenthes gracilis TaxID=150966 RepID=A0AAD3S6R3_NEPGR|nr:hypothetical protein Nepgr_007382 [Nepenthes gracilis]